MRPAPRSPPCLAVVALAASAALLLIYGAWPGGDFGGGASSSSRAGHQSRAAAARQRGPGSPPAFAYWISGTGGEGRRVLRLLRAVYHPRNRYRAWREFGNVDVVGEGYAVDRTGSSVLAATLHGAAVLLRIADDWDWFVTLSSWDYPLVTQNDLLYAFSSVSRELNFIDHTSDLGWKEHERFEKLIVDPSLYMDRSTELLPVTEQRQMPDAFKIFTGSPWIILSRNFTKHCVHGWDNLPRKLLMYFANTAYSMESYFQTVICNSSEFRNTTVNGDLRYFVWDDPPGLEPVVLDESHFDSMVNSSAAFARRFAEDAPVLKKVDDELLSRSSVCKSSRQKRAMDVESCSKWGDMNVAQPAPSGERLKRFISEISGTRGCTLTQSRI
ncbi:hypothetical protein GUJ93_ZPchr0004g39573 [Zizania palustris]|uniref:Uncharacterized protein n=1 Tax=Zizania palustris TaxID=103762 RepID=A0A8J5RW87_ZIZPA|nr:hypothetical protein GUJ93_ZPchr0004g39573 [Zizania palustris]